MGQKVKVPDGRRASCGCLDNIVPSLNVINPAFLISVWECKGVKYLQSDVDSQEKNTPSQIL